MSKILFPGSFDPPTLGHTDLIRRAASLFDEVVVAVLVNIHKAGRFTIPERVRMLEACCKDIRNVRVLSYEGLLVDLAGKENVGAVLRGVRSAADFDIRCGLPIRIVQREKQVAPKLQILLMP